MSPQTELLRCPRCLADIPRRRWQWLCAADCPNAPQPFSLTTHPATRSTPREQSRDCPRADCLRIRIDLQVDSCDTPLSHPLGLAPERISHTLFLAQSEPELGKLLSGHIQALRLLRGDAMAIPGDTGTRKRWSREGLPLGAVSASPNGAPLALHLPASRPEEWGGRAYLHAISAPSDPLPSDQLPCPEAQRMDAAAKLQRCDALVVGLSATRLLRRGHVIEVEQAQRWAEWLQQALAASATGAAVWFCLIDEGGRFLSALGETPRGRALLELDAERLAEILTGYVAHATRFASDSASAALLNLPWQRIHYSLLTLPAAEAAAVAGLRGWVQGLGGERS